VFRGIYCAEESLNAAPILDPLFRSVPLELMCDALSYSIGVVLGQHIDRKSHEIYYSIHVLDDAWVNYTLTKKEFFSCGLCF